MGRTHAFEALSFTRQFEKSYKKLAGPIQVQCQEALKQLQVSPLAPGLRTKPIRPNNVYYEVRVNDGDRLVIYPDRNVAYIMDVIPHDQIKRWGSIGAPEIG